MAKAQVNAIVRGYLHSWEIPFGANEDGGSFQILHGSTGVYVDFYEHQPHTVVRLRAIVLDEVEEESPIGLLAVINGDLPFANFCFYPDQKLVTLEYELIGETMDEDEFRNAVIAVANIADGWDEQLQSKYEFGGKRHEEVLAQAADREV